MKSRTQGFSDPANHVPEYGDIAVSTRISSAATKQAAVAAFICPKPASKCCSGCSHGSRYLSRYNL
jgi:hypothetical protein